ncbi:hypothetical protein Goarm_012556 [Gossypium armourianum]|uniref:Uncharacterized protein n=1 Tax=Gossypium armourianum TaxID=34283 RepID=A0A7J9J1A9_9ROSI|nr:hypothetical protein [Gossypium armourianum]
MDGNSPQSPRCRELLDTPLLVLRQYRSRQFIPATQGLA